MRLRTLWWVAAVAAGMFGCDDGAGNGPPGGGGDTMPAGDSNIGNPGAPAPWNTLSFTVEDIAVDASDAAFGYQGSLVQDPVSGTLYYSHFKDLNTRTIGPNVVTATCDIAAFGGDAAPGSNYEMYLHYRAPSDTMWNEELIPLDQLNMMIPYATNRYGIDATFDGNGDYTMAFAGTAMSGLFTCGSGDLVLATRMGAMSWNIRDTGVTPGSCCADCTDPGGCMAGTDVGPWASIALDNSNNLAVAFMDYHNNVVEDGQTRRGLEFWEEGSGQVDGIRTYQGKGAFSDLVYVTGGTYQGPLVAYVKRKGGGLFVARRVGTGGSEDMDWEETVLLPGQQAGMMGSEGFLMGERLSMAKAPNGNVGLVAHLEFHDDGSKIDDLMYWVTADNGDTWSIPETIDIPIAVLGFPSLAFDSQNNPAVAYYFCGTTQSCGNSSDGPRFVWREPNGRWWVWQVHSDASTRSGFFTGLVMDPTDDHPILVFQDLAAGGGQSRGAVMWAEGSF